MTTNKNGLKPASSLTLNEVSKFWSYDPETGLFTKLTNSTKYKAGFVTPGSQISIGYYSLWVPGYGSVYAHRLAILFMTGIWPAGLVDHINMDRTDNRYVNLRESSYSMNNHNTPVRKDNTSGIRNVCWCKRNKRWIAYLRFEKKQYGLGYFKDKEEAKEAVLAKRKELGIELPDAQMFRNPTTKQPVKPTIHHVDVDDVEWELNKYLNGQ